MIWKTTWARASNAWLSGTALACLASQIVAAPIHAQTATVEKPASAKADRQPVDLRIGLKPGFEDAGTAISGLRLVAHSPPPSGFVDPEGPDGQLVLPRPGTRDGHALGYPSKLAFINTDMAFSGNLLVMGNYNGMLIYDIADPAHPTLRTALLCPGGENDVAIHGNLVFMGVEERRARLDCSLGDKKADVSKERFRGVRIFDISQVENPQQIAAIQTCQGSHTFTLLPDLADPKSLYIYNSGLNGSRSSQELAGCSDKPPSEDPNTSLYSIDVIKVPLDAPEKSAIVSHPRVFADPKTGRIDGLTEGGDRGPDLPWSYSARQCHDITVYPDHKLAAAACMGAGLLLDISNPVEPVRLDWQTDPNFGTWHSATFNNDATKLLFTDEWGSGILPLCQPSTARFWGGDGIWSIDNGKMSAQGYYKIPPTQTELDSCASHNGNLIPVPGRDILVQGWFQGGMSIVDFTDAKHPVELAYYDRGPLGTTPHVGGIWSAYWYNGRIYTSDVTRGLQVFALEPTDMLTANEIAAAELVRVDESNPQTQRRVHWPDSPVVARAYLDQLLRSEAIPKAKAEIITKALDRIEHGKGGRAFAALAHGLNTQAEAAAPENAVRLRGIARVLQR